MGVVGRGRGRYRGPQAAELRQRLVELRFGAFGAPQGLGPRLLQRGQAFRGGLACFGQRGGEGFAFGAGAVPDVRDFVGEPVAFRAHPGEFRRQALHPLFGLPGLLRSPIGVLLRRLAGGHGFGQLLLQPVQPGHELRPLGRGSLFDVGDTLLGLLALLGDECFGFRARRCHLLPGFDAGRLPVGEGSVAFLGTGLGLRERRITFRDRGIACGYRLVCHAFRCPRRSHR